MLILPPFQGEGHGAQLLEAVHRFYCSLPKVQDITGEHFINSIYYVEEGVDKHLNVRPSCHPQTV